MHGFTIIYIGRHVLTNRSTPFGSCTEYAGTIMCSVFSSEFRFSDRARCYSDVGLGLLLSPGM